LLKRVRGSKLRLLNREANIWAIAYLLLNQVAAMTDDHRDG
jgi:hypothetical protein